MIQGNGESVIKRNGVVAAPAFCALPILRSRFSKLTRFSGVLCGLCRCSHVAAEALWRSIIPHARRRGCIARRAAKTLKIPFYISIRFRMASIQKRGFVMSRFVKKRDSVPSLPFVSPERAFVIE